MKITFIVWLIVRTGGVRVILKVANGLTEKGHDVNIVTLGGRSWFPLKVKIQTRGEIPVLGRLLHFTNIFKLAKNLPDSDITLARADNLLNDNGVTVYSKGKWYNNMENIELNIDTQIFPRGHPYAKEINPPSSNITKNAIWNWFQFATPILGSLFFNTAKHYGEVLTYDWSRCHHQEPIFIPEGLDRKTLIKLRDYAFKETNAFRFSWVPTLIRKNTVVQKLYSCIRS